MPLVSFLKPLFKPKRWADGHWQTIAPSIKRKISLEDTSLLHTRERIYTPDADFLDLDWYTQKEMISEQLVVVLHGLEGNSQRHYAQGLIRHFGENGWDALGYNCRSCSGEMNWQPRFYHHADSADLHTAVQHVVATRTYKQLFFVGFSMGGNIIAKYLAEIGSGFAPTILGGVGVSCPFWLEDCAIALETKPNMLYNSKFVKSIAHKAIRKAQIMPERFKVSVQSLAQVRTCREFDVLVTVPYGGFDSPQHFYEQGSMGTHIEQVKVPFFLLQALNDPFLPSSCYPQDLAIKQPHFYLEISQEGGHVGFECGKGWQTYSEKQALEFAHACLREDFTTLPTSQTLLRVPERSDNTFLGGLLTLKRLFG